jgi:hypothetical protein
LQVFAHIAGAISPTATGFFISQVRTNVPMNSYKRNLKG